MSIKDYTNLEFFDLVSDLKTKLEEKETWKNLTNATTVQALIESVVSASSQMIYMNQRYFEENLVDSAQFWESLMRLGNLPGYKPKRPQGASATILITPGGSETTISKDTVYQINGFDFYFESDVTVPASGDDVEVVLKQGTLVQQSVTVNEAKDFQRYVFGSENTTEENIIVQVDGVTWNKVDFVLLGKGDSMYQINTLPDRTIELMFGIEDTGRPLVGQQIDINAYNVVGTDANYFGANPTHAGTISSLEVTVNTPIVGGADFEDVESLRTNVPLSWRMKSGIVAKNSYKGFLENYPGIKKVKVLDVRDAKQVPFRVVRVYVLPDGGYESSDAFFDEVQSYLDKILPAGVKLELYNPLIRDVIVSISLQVLRGFVKSTVIDNVHTEIENRYKVDNLDFGEWVTTSELRQLATSVDGVASATVARPKDNISTMKDWEFLKLIQLEVT